MNDKLIFSNRIDHHSVDVSPAGNVVTVKLYLSEALETPDVDSMDIDAIHAQLRAEGEAAVTGSQAQPDTNADPSGESALKGGPSESDAGTADGGTHDAASEVPGNDPGSDADEDIQRDDQPKRTRGAKA